jgi:hypothetical protein
MFGNAGFFNDGNDMKEDMDNKGSKGSNDAEKKKPKMFVPVTLHMLDQSTTNSDDKFKIEGEEVTDIIVVGRLTSKDEQATRTAFDLCDNTGTFRVIFYNREENVLPTFLQNFDYESGCYVKIFGAIRMFKDVKNIVGTHLTKITDFDELTNHFLQVFTGSCVRRKGTMSSDEIAGGQGGKHMSADDIKTYILNCFRDLAKDKKGVKKDEIYEVCKRQIKYPEFEQGLKQLEDDMTIFSPEDGLYTAY